MDHEMSLNEEAFERVRSNKKVIEIRLLDEKRKKVVLGDRIILAKLPDKKEKITVEVLGLTYLKKFRDVFLLFDRIKFGHPESMTLQDKINAMYEHYTPAEEEQYGVLAIYFKVIS